MPEVGQASTGHPQVQAPTVDLVGTSGTQPSLVRKWTYLRAPWELGEWMDDGESARELCGWIGESGGTLEPLR